MNDLSRSSLLFRGGTIRTMSSEIPTVEAVAIRDGTVVAMGSLTELRRLDGFTEVDLKGGCLCPGFVDAHNHMTLAAVLQDVPSCATGVRTLDDVLALVRSRCDEVSSDRWVVVAHFEPGKVREDAFPSLSQLDRISATRPLVVLSSTLHEAAVNSEGLKRLGGEALVADPQSHVVVDPSGRPTGEIRDKVVARLLQILSAECVAEGASAARKRMGLAAVHLARHGIVHVVDPGVGGAQEQLIRYYQEDAAGCVGVSFMRANHKGLYLAPSDRLGDERAAKQVKFFVDGGAYAAMTFSEWESLRFLLALPGMILRSRSLRPLNRATRNKVPLGPDKHYHSGTLMFEREGLRTMVNEAMSRGYAVAMHVQGNEAIDFALDALSARKIHGPAELPDQLVHFMFPTREQVCRAGDLGVAVVVQPWLWHVTADDILQSLAPVGTFSLGPPFKDIAESGALLVGSSDAPVADVSPIQAMSVVRDPKSATGRGSLSKQNVSPIQALEMYTVNAAKAAGLDTKGVIGVDKKADLVYLSLDPLITENRRLSSVKVKGTYKSGRLVWHDGSV